jgi:metallophosphoesterase (TIGR00282 family)
MVRKTPILLVDFHAEATSEKVALGWFLDGKVSAVLGTHTHIQTSDERVLPQGTAYMTDVGMTGPADSVIGVKKELAIDRFLTQLPNKFEVAKRELVLEGAVVTVDPQTGRATGISRIREKLNTGSG